MKKIVLVLIFVSLGLFSCVEESCKTCTTTVTYDDVVQDDLTYLIDYCGEDLEFVEDTPPDTSFGAVYTMISTIACE